MKKPKRAAKKPRWTKAETKRIIDRAFTTIMLAFAQAALVEGLPKPGHVKIKPPKGLTNPHRRRPNRRRVNG